MARKSLSDILGGSDRDRIGSAWNSTIAAADDGPLPKGKYDCLLESGELFNARTRGTPGYKLRFVVQEGEFSGRKIWHDLYLTPAAMASTKRDLSKIGIVNLEQLEKPLPGGIVCRVVVSLRTDDDGTQYNRVRSFDVLRIEPPEADPFTPPDTPDDDLSEGVTE